MVSGIAAGAVCAGAVLVCTVVASTVFIAIAITRIGFRRFGVGYEFAYAPAVGGLVSCVGGIGLVSDASPFASGSVIDVEIHAVERVWPCHFAQRDGRFNDVSVTSERGGAFHPVALELLIARAERQVVFSADPDL